MLEAHVHGLPTPNVKFYRDGHLIHARKNKVVFFLEDKEIFQCLLVRPDASVSGLYTVLAENKAGKKRYDHHVDFVTKYPLIHLPGMRHADKNLDDFVEEMLEKIPKHPEPTVEEIKTETGADAAVTGLEPANVEVPETPKAEEIAEALQAVVDSELPKPEGETEEKKVEEKPKKHKSKSKSKHRKKDHKSVPKIDADLINDGEDETEDVVEPEEVYKRKFSTVIHEPYETETFRIYNTKNNLWFSGNLRDQTAIEGTTIKLLCAVSGPMPIMKWLKNGKPVSWGNNMRNMTGEGIGLVIIDKIAKVDAGVYSCTAKNEFNEVTTESVVKVIPRSSVPRTDTSKPFFSRVLGEFYHITEDDLILDAHVRAVPEPKIVWYKDGIELNASMDNRYDFSINHDGGYQLRIHKPTAADSALYACEAENTEGKAKVSHKVIFTEQERHTHPQFVYHKESFWQPTLRMSIEPEPVKKDSTPAPEILRAAIEIIQAAGQSGSGGTTIATSKDSGDSGNQETNRDGEGSTEAPSGGSGAGGDGNEDGDGEPKDLNNVPEDGEEEEEEKQEKKPEKRAKSSRRRRYEGPIEPLLIRDSVSNVMVE